MKLRNKLARITEDERAGLGKSFVAEGDDVFITGRRQSELELAVGR